MNKEVKRWSPDTNGRMREWPDGDYASWDDYEALLEENQRLRQLTSEKVMSSTMLREFVARDGGLNIGLEGGACALMAQAFGKQLYDSEALNYVEASFESPDYPDLGQITVTVKRESGKTPHQLRKDAEAERDALLAERDRMEDTLKHIRDTIDAQMAIIASRAPGKYLDKLPVVRSLRMHRNHADAALQGEQP